MKTKEKLSDKEYLLFNDEDWIRLGDVKEFISKFRNRIRNARYVNDCIPKEAVIIWIEEFAGEDLI